MQTLILLVIVLFVMAVGFIWIVYDLENRIKELGDKIDYLEKRTGLDGYNEPDDTTMFFTPWTYHEVSQEEKIERHKQLIQLILGEFNLDAQWEGEGYRLQHTEEDEE